VYYSLSKMLKPGNGEEPPAKIRSISDLSIPLQRKRSFACNSMMSALYLIRIPAKGHIEQRISIMKHNRAFLFIILASTLVFLSACVNPVREPTPMPTAEPTPEPQPTATEARVESDYYSYIEGVWTRYYEDELTFPFFLPEEMEGGDSQNYQMIQSGYFAAFDAETQVITMRTLVIMAKIYREVQFQLDENLTVACLPAEVNGTAMEELRFLYSAKGVGFPPGAGNYKVSEIIAGFNSDTYMVLILEAPVDPQAINLVEQIAAICPE